jgi:hypothetical protein
MTKLDGIQDDWGLGVGLDYLESVVGIEGRANIETWFWGEVPRLPSSRLCMGEDATTNQTKWHLVEVKGALEKFLCTNPWFECGLMEKIEGEFILWQKKIPKVWWKGGIDTGKNCQEVVLEHANSAFILVLAMHVQWDKLEFCIPLEGDCFLVCRAGLVVKNLEVHGESPCCQACHNVIVGCNLMAVTFGL